MKNKKLLIVWKSTIQFRTTICEPSFTKIQNAWFERHLLPKTSPKDFLSWKVARGHAHFYAWVIFAYLQAKFLRYRRSWRNFPAAITFSAKKTNTEHKRKVLMYINHKEWKPCGSCAMQQPEDCLRAGKSGFRLKSDGLVKLIRG